MEIIAMTRPNNPDVINSDERIPTAWDDGWEPSPRAASPERTAAHEAGGHGGSRGDAGAAYVRVDVNGDPCDTHDLADAANLVDDADLADDVGSSPWDSPELSQQMIDDNALVDIGEASCLPTGEPDPAWGIYLRALDAELRSLKVHGGPGAPPGRKPPARETRVRDVARDFCTVEEMSRETHWSRTHIREWFLEHPGDCQVIRHPETMHRRRYNSLRISPEARAAFYAAHAA